MEPLLIGYARTIPPTRSAPPPSRSIHVSCRIPSLASPRSRDRLLSRFRRPGLFLAIATCEGAFAAALAGEYVTKGNRADTVRGPRSRLTGCRISKASGTTPGRSTTPTAPGFDFAYPPEKRVDLKATYQRQGRRRSPGRNSTEFPLGKVVDLAHLFRGARTDAVVYLYHEFESPARFKLPLSLGSDDTLSVFFNGKRVLHEDRYRAPRRRTRTASMWT